MATHTPRYNLSKPENTDEMTSFMSDYADNMDKIDENLGGGGGSANIVELTQAEYDALPDTKLTDDTMYLIKDANSASDAEFTHVYGLYIDETNKLFEGTMTNFTQTLEYTATEDAIALVDYSGSSSTNQWFLINNVIIPFRVLSSGRDSFTVPIRKGDKISARHTSDNEGCYFHLVVYGVKTGSEVTFLSEYASACYSTQEREVGCWIDGKPLYQRSFFFNNQVIPDNAWTYNILGGNLTGIEIKDYEGYFGLENTDFAATFDYFRNNDGGFNEFFTANSTGTDINVRPNMNAGVNVILRYCTIWYTKTADVAGSGQWTPMAQPTHHYSTSEQVVGTWIDGKPMYEKTVNCEALPNNTTKNVAHSISDIEYVVSIQGSARNPNNGIQIPLPYVYGNIKCVQIYIDPTYIKLISTENVSVYTQSYVTIQYTKTTD